MPRVCLTGDLGRRFAGGDVEIPVDTGPDGTITVKRIIRLLDEKYPGIKDVLESDAVAVAIDGAIHQDALFEDVKQGAEVYFMPAIRGG